MPVDYRVKIGFAGHPKRKKLRRRTGSDGVIALIDLWEFCASSRPDGRLRGMDYEDIALAAEYDGDHVNWVSALLDLGFLDGEPDDLRVHDWLDHNPWVAGADERSYNARRNVHVRWTKERRHHKTTEFCDDKCQRFDPSNGPGDTKEYGIDTTAIPDVTDRNSKPYDTQYSVTVPASVTDTDTSADPDVPREIKPTVLTSQPTDLKISIAHIFDHWRSKHQDDFMTPHPGLREWREISKRITQDSITTKQIIEAIDGIHLDKWEDRHKNMTLFHVVKSASAVQRFRAMATEPEPVKPPPTRGWGEFQDEDQP